MKSKAKPSPARQKLAESFKKTTESATHLRYGSMRKVKFSGWSDIGRFAQYARDQLAAAKVAEEQLDYWECLYDLLTKGQLTRRPVVT